MSSCCVERGDEFCWDELERLVLGAEELPRHIALAAGNARLSRAIDHAPATDPSWRVLMSDASPHHELYRALCELIRPLSAAARPEALRQLRAQCSEECRTRPSHRLLTPAEVAELYASPAGSVGAHSRDHDVLVLQPLEAQRRAIESDREVLTKWCGREPRVSSYPCGGRDSFSKETVDLVEQCGFDGACANYPALIRRRYAVFSTTKAMKATRSSSCASSPLGVITPAVRS